mgnify:CR=1 FL=1
MVNRHVFKSSRGQKLHSYNCCDLKKCKSEVKCYDKDDVYGPLCTKCFDTCMICFSEPGWKTCNEHSVCDGCFKNYISDSDFNFSCPCGKKGLDPRNFSYDTLMTLYNSRGKKVVKENAIDKYVHILNETCPGCDKVFCDFDACAALYCRCGTYFCGFCFETLDNMSSAHDHVKSCSLNPSEGELFINLESWEKIRLQVKKKERIQFYKSLAKNGIIDYTYYWIKLLKFNTLIENILFIRFIIYCFLVVK